MRICVNGIYRDMTEEEIKAMEEQDDLAEKEYWTNADYEEAVNNEIRKKYSVSQEFAILRQKDEKPQEYQEYYNYCEECKSYVKSKKEVGD
jgi:hypothetical protein